MQQPVPAYSILLSTRNINCLFLVLAFILPFTGARAQNPVTDSLSALVKAAKDDTGKVILLNRLSKEYWYTDPAQASRTAHESFVLSRKLHYAPGVIRAINSFGELRRLHGDFEGAMRIYKLSYDISKISDDKDGLAIAINNIGIYYMEKHDYKTSLRYLEDSYKIREALNDTSVSSIQAKISNITNRGTLYYLMNDLEKALQLWLQSLKLAEQYKQKKYEADVRTNIAVIYTMQGDFEASQQYYNRSLGIYKELNNRYGIAHVYGNMAENARQMGDTANAISYGLTAIKLNSELNERKGMASAYNNLGAVYGAAGQTKKALEYFTRSMELRIEMGDSTMLVTNLANIAQINFDNGNIPGAEEYVKRAMDVVKLTDNQNDLPQLYMLLSEISRVKKDFSGAYNYHVLYTHIRDSISAREKNVSLTRLQNMYENEKKDKELQLLSKDKALQGEQLSKQRLIAWSASGGFLLTIGLAFFIYRGYRQKKRDNELLETAYTTIEDKNKEITDSINYAKRIQSAILPSDERIKQHLPQSFILYRPKDIISGDFYWFAEKDNTMLLAAADCTGHGVPGALMSMIGNDLLNQVVNEKGITSPARVLALLHEGVRAALKQDDTSTATRDGMDIALIAIDKSTHVVRFAGANRPLWIISRNESGEPSLNEIKPDKLPVGGIQSEERRAFKEHVIHPVQGDMLYIFSDGFADQFGGASGKKFMTKNMKEMLLAAATNDPAEQKSIIEEAHVKWKGNAEQVDDILVIGVRL